ncbi:MAG: PilZ domain-containing protein [Myxococcales bacterium]|nr:PilZ domain-containing protein [Myxococcales bacterium]
MNKRFVPRQRRRLKVALGGRLPAFTADVSPGGFSFETMRVARPGTQLHGSLTLEGREFDFTGEVTWAFSGDPRLSVRGRVGVRFTGISNDFFQLFRDVLLDCGRESRVERRASR